MRKLETFAEIAAGPDSSAWRPSIREGGDWSGGMMRTMVAALWVACAGALYAEEAAVTTFASSAEMEKAVLDDDATLWVVHFYAGPGAGGGASEDKVSPGMVGDFAAAAGELASSLGARAGAVDVSVEANAKIAKRFGVTVVPTILGFGGPAAENPYTHKLDRTPLWFDTQSFSKAALKRWVGGKVPGDVVACKFAYFEKFDAG